MTPGAPEKPGNLSPRAAHEWDRLVAELDASSIHVSKAYGTLTLLAATIAADPAEAWEVIKREVVCGWSFPGAERVHFDANSRDLIIAGKGRGARGKGLRAITHAAFTIGLLDYCKSKSTPHPGFVILDSPLLAYRAPEGTEEDL